MDYEKDVKSDANKIKNVDTREIIEVLSDSMKAAARHLFNKDRILHSFQKLSVGLILNSEDDKGDDDCLPQHILCRDR